MSEERKKEAKKTNIGYLLEASAEALKEILTTRKETLAEEEILAIIKNKNLNLEVLKLILSHKPFLVSYEVKKALLFLKILPYTEGLKLLPHMYWMDLMLLSTTMSVHPIIRRTSEKKLAEKIPEMGLGEKISLARRGSYNTLLILAKEKEPKVIEALLQNRFTTEDIVVSIAGNPQATPEILGIINYNPKWRNRLQVKKALILNKNFPQYLAMHLLNTMSKSILEEFSESSLVSDKIKEYCKYLLKKKTKEN